MKLGLTNTARGIVYLMFTAVVTVCGVLVPELAREEAVGKANPPVSWPFLVGVWVLAVPIFVALREAHKILRYIDEGAAFSARSVKALKTIKICTATFATLVAASVATTITLSRMVDPTEDSAGFAMIGIVVVSITSVIFTFVAVLQKLLQNTVDMKLENELTV